MSIHLKLDAEKAHTRLHHILQLGRTGFWPVSLDAIDAHEFAYLWEMHPTGGFPDEAGSLTAPWVAKVRIKNIYHVKFFDKTRSILEFDTHDVVCALQSAIPPRPSFLPGGVVYSQEHDYL